MELTLVVNGKPWSGEVPPRLTLADFLRDRLKLRGTHLGCEHGVCGACTVLVDERAMRSCLMFAVQADGQQVLTVEGMSRDGAHSPLQQAFLDHGAFQCGFCTPGFLASAEELLRSGRRYSRSELRERLAGNICRCTGYDPIVEAVFSCQS
jgi:aerobic-type carbon monoxide dehydrogenase small subunit (CoxS/CutS family)